MTDRQPTPGVHENFASKISPSPDPQSQKWYPWNGGDMPVPRGTAVEVILRYGKQVVDQAGGGYATRWSHNGPMGGHDDIVFYRLYTPPPQSHLRGIETAPKDGTWFIAYQNGEPFPCDWRTEEQDEGPPREGWFDFFNRSFEDPTHWLPVWGAAKEGPDNG